VIITGEGKAFAAGADISKMKDFTPAQAQSASDMGSRSFRRLEQSTIPVIAAVNGYALGGGCELALACDIRIASVYAKFGQPEIKIGVIPGYGGTQRLPRSIPTGIAKEMIYTGDIIDASTAERIGLVNRVVPAEKLMVEALAIAQKISSLPPLAMKLAKKIINQGNNKDLDQYLALESEYFGKAFETKDQKEGMAAFLEKRPPKFTGT
jgi:enoyl-CoA hydratase